MGDVMEFGVAWADGGLGFVVWVFALVEAVWQRLSELQARYPQLLNPQNLVGLAGFVFAIWK